MFESLKHWLDSLDKQSKLFENPDDEVLHSALASVLYHIISEDGRIGRQEKQEFKAILKQEFNLDEAQSDHLFLAAESSNSDLLADLHTINRFLKDSPKIRMNFMEKIIHLVSLDGVKDRELDIFYEALHEVFPKIAGR